MKKKRKLGRKLLSFLLTLAMVVGLMSGMSLTAYAANTYSLVPVHGQSGETYSITPSEDTLDAVKTALAVKMSLDTETKEIWLYRFEMGMGDEIDRLDDTMYYKVKSKPQEIVAGKTYVIGDSLYFHADKYYNNGYVNTGSYLFGSDISKGQEILRLFAYNNSWYAAFEQVNIKLEEPSGHTFDSSVQPIGFKIADDSGDGSTAQNYIKFEAVYASPKTDQTVTAPVAVSNLTYTGSAQTLVSAATVTTGNTSGSITYSLDGTNYSADLPTGTNVGTYNVYYKVAGNDDYNEFVSALPVSVSIGKATPTVTAPTATNPTYTGAAQDLITAGSTTGGEMQYSLDGSNYSTTIPQGTNTGDYTVYYKVVGNNNYNDVAAQTVKSTISDKPSATITTAPQAKTLTYTGSAQELVTAGTSSGGTMKYAVTTANQEPAAEAYTFDNTSIPTGTDAGTYYVWYKVVGDENHNDTESACVTSIILDEISQTVTFKVVNGSWNEGVGDVATADKTVTLTGYEGDTLKLTADQIPAVGSKPNDTYKAGSWDVTPSTDTEITEATTYTYTYAQQETITKTVTFKVVNGSWDDGTTADKTVTLSRLENEDKALVLQAGDIPEVGSKPGEGYKAGNWDVVPSTETVINENKTYTYTYAQQETITKTVTFKVVNGSWNDGTTADKNVTLSRLENEDKALVLQAGDIPAVGSKPDAGYKAGSWDVVPSTEAVINKDTTYTYTYEKEEVKNYSYEWVEGKWYNKDGSQTYKPLGSWKKDGKDWMYADSSGWYAKNRWQKIDFKWYFFDKEGHMLKDAYQKDASGKIWYIGKNGAWDEKAAVIGWKQDSKGWWFGLYGKEYLKSTWKMINGNWYYFKETGYIAMNEFIRGWWLNKAGAWKDPVRYSWHKSGSKWWYGVKDGWYAKDRSYTIDGKKYTFDKKGYTK